LLFGCIKNHSSERYVAIGTEVFELGKDQIDEKIKNIVDTVDAGLSMTKSFKIAYVPLQNLRDTSKAP
jgi:hypothetical protein